MAEHTQLWVGIDLGSRTHQVCALNERKEVVFEPAIEHSGASITSVIAELIELASGSADRVHVALETPQSAVVEMLLERGIEVYTINPKQLDRFATVIRWLAPKTTGVMHSSSPSRSAPTACCSDT